MCDEKVRDRSSVETGQIENEKVDIKLLIYINKKVY